MALEEWAECKFNSIHADFLHQISPKSKSKYENYGHKIIYALK